MAVDASVAVKWLLEEEGSDRALDYAAQEALVAPALLRAEVGNALFKKVRRGEIGAPSAIIAHGALGAFVHEWIELDELADEAFAIACELLHPIYDCYYLALMEIRGLSLLTADKRLVGICAGTRFEERLVQP